MTTSIKAHSDGLSGSLQVEGSDVMRFGADNSGQLAGFRNRLINAGCVVGQRGNVAILANSAQYGGADRWLVSNNCISISAGTIARASVGNGAGSGYGQNIVGLSAVGLTQLIFAQRIEALNCSGLNGKTVTLSAKVFHNTGLGTVTASIGLSRPTTTADDFSAQTALSVSTPVVIPSGTSTKITHTFTLGSTDANLGLQFYVTFGGTIGTITTKDFVLFEPQFELGSIATPFEIRQYGLELDLCYRYYETGSFYFVAYALGGNGWGGIQTFHTRKRSTPTMTFTNVTVTNVTNAGLACNVDGIYESGTATVTGTAIHTGTYYASIEL